MKLPNIYESKNLKVLVLIPVILMFIGIFLSTQIVLDSTLAGGVSVLVQTNTTLSAQQIASAVATQLNTQSPSVQVSPGGLQITITDNKTLSAAQNYLINLYSFDSNYSTYLLNATTYSIDLQQNPDNRSAAANLSIAEAGENASIAGMQTQLALEIKELQPFVPGASFSSSDPDAMAAYGEGLFTNASSIYQNHVVTVLHNILPFTTYSYQSVTATLGRYFLNQLEVVIIVAFILISIVVFFIFRSPIVSLAIVFGAANDIIIALGMMGLFKIPLGIASIGGLLMLIGYSIDTEVLTAMRILKRHEGTVEERAYGAMKTGLTMTSTAIVSFGVLFIVSLITYVPTYSEISSVVLFGLIGDIFTTWFGNTALILMYKKRKEAA